MTDGPIDWVVLDCVTVLHSTDLAVLVEVDGFEEWVPRSQLHPDDTDAEPGCYDEMRVQRWIAEEKELDHREDPG